jgi:hypothetical protein
MPVSTLGASKSPKHQDKQCFGRVFKTPRNKQELLGHKFNLEYLNTFIEKKNSIHSRDFFTSKAFFNLLLGTDKYKITKRGVKFKRTFKRRNKTLLESYKKLVKRYYLY